jgi:hypothetical protein
VETLIEEAMKLAEAMPGDQPPATPEVTVS